MDNTKRQGPDQNRNLEDHSNERHEGHVNIQNTSADLGDDSLLDEKSSTMGRRHKDTGIASKDGVTGSDLDGQVSE